MVSPEGTAENYEVLKENKVICYPKLMNYDLDLPVIDDHGFAAIPSPISLDRDPYCLSKEHHFSILNNYIYRVTPNNLVFHFWFHPSMDRRYLQNIMHCYCGLFQNTEVLVKIRL